MSAISGPFDQAWYQRQQTELHAEFGRAWDEWLARALSRRPLVHVPSVASLLDIASAEAASTVDPIAVRESADLVFDLARLCRTFVWSDLWSTAVHLHQQRLSVEEIGSQLTTRTRAVLPAAFARKWRIGLQVLDGHRWGLTLSPWDSQSPDPEPADGDVFPRGLHLVENDRYEVWDAVVLEDLADFLQRELSAAALREVDDTAPASHRSPNAPIQTQDRRRVEEFFQRVMSETGVRVTSADFVLVAGYDNVVSGKKLLQWFKSGSDHCTTSARQNFDRVLGYAPSEFLTIRERRRAVINSRSTER